MISKLEKTDFQLLLNLVNNAAVVYRGKIPSDRWKEPYMTAEELTREIGDGVQFYGWVEHDVLVAAMGIQAVNNVTLIRHAYVLTNHQRRGYGEKLLKHLLAIAETSTVYVGTWEAATWAINFYQKNGFKLVSNKEKDKLLKKYWNIPNRQVETSVVLRLERQL